MTAFFHYSASLPGQVCPGKSARASLPGKSAGQVCQASLPGKSARHVRTKFVMAVHRKYFTLISSLIMSDQVSDHV
jgi:hypothetical protein